MRSRTALSSPARWGCSASSDSTPTRSPRRHASRWCSRTATRGVGSLIAALLEAELLAEPGQGAVQLLAEGGGRAAELLGDAVPVVALVAQLDQPALVGGEP